MPLIEIEGGLIGVKILRVSLEDSSINISHDDFAGFHLWLTLMISKYQRFKEFIV